MTSFAKSNYVTTTKAELEKEFQQNGWGARLSKCEPERVDKNFEFSAGSQNYRRQTLTKHFENGELIAFTIEYTLHNGQQIRQLKMLVVNGVRHIVP
jgi:hypothetical protein